MDIGTALFDSSIGTLGIAWSARGLRRIQLPEGSRAATARRLAQLVGAPFVDVPPPPWVRRAIADLVAHLEGAPRTFADLPLDYEGVPDFYRRVYEASRAVESGRTATYGDIARVAGSPGASRAVGRALANNPLAIVVPCHRVLASNGRPGGFSARGGVSTKAALLAIEGVRLPSERARVPGLFGASFDADEAVRCLAEADPKLGRVIDQVGAFTLRIAPKRTTFEALAHAIVYQQLTGKAAKTIFDRLKATCASGGALEPSAVVAASDDALRGAGLSRAKTAALRDLATRTLDGTVPGMAELRKLDDDAIVDRLTVVRGIGRWTVEMLLIFRLGRPDVLPVDDYGVRKGFARTLGRAQLPTPKDVARRGERWRPYRSVASWYLWRAAEQLGARR